MKREPRKHHNSYFWEYRKVSKKAYGICPIRDCGRKAYVKDVVANRFGTFAIFCPIHDVNYAFYEDLSDTEDQESGPEYQRPGT